MAGGKKAAQAKPMTLGKFEGSKADKSVDKAAVKKINAGKGK